MSPNDGDQVALDSVVKTRDGFFTTFLVSPYSKHVARFAARRRWTPNAVTAVSCAVGIAAAASFAAGTRAGLITGAVLLQVSFTLDCVDGQLARYTRTFSNLGAWLDSILDRGKEALVYAGLALGANRGFDQDVWLLAAAALVVQTVRHMVDLSYLAAARDVRAPAEEAEGVPARRSTGSRPSRARTRGSAATSRGAGAATARTRTALAGNSGGPTRPEKRGGLGLATLAQTAVTANRTLERYAVTRWAKRILVLPIGERFALISLTAAIANPRMTFLVLLGWGSVATVYALAVRITQTVAK
jgi:phosphatidylglycerophosphate synthase